MPRDAWRFRLNDMIAAIEQIQSYTDAIDRDAFMTSDLVADAVAFRIAVIGEAANAIPESVRANHAAIAWAGVRGMRNRIVHEYFRLQRDTLWRTVKEELPTLERQLRALLLEIQQP